MRIVVVMRIVVAPDESTGSMSAAEVAAHGAAGLAEAAPSARSCSGRPA